MKRHLLLALLLGSSLSVTAETLRLSDPVESGPGFEVFGVPMSDKGPAPSLTAVIDAGSESLGDTVRISTTVTKVCQKKGCFFIAAEGDRWARVTFKDYSFFVPTDSGGKSVTLEGVLSRKELSESEARHYAADLGEDASAGSGSRSEYSIVATSVLVRES